MIFRKRILAPLVAAATTLAATAALTVTAATAQAATTTLCNGQSAAVAGGAYTAQNNEWNSSAPECITTDGNADFTVANSSISTLGNGAPGGYPSIYKGCHWGACTSNSGLPVQVSAMTPGTVTTSWNTTQTYTGAYDVAYDIWYNHTPTTSGQPNAEEMMIWLNHNGPVQPAGSVVASNVSIGGRTYNVWVAQMSSWVDVSYVMTSGTTSVSNLDLAPLVADSKSRGILSNSDYLIDLEAGFEIWQGGAGLATNSYSVNIGSGGGSTGGGGGGSTGALHAVGAGKCLDDPNSTTTLATQMQIWDCNGGANQTWTHTSSGQLTLAVGGTTLCLDASGQGTSPGTKAIIWSCNGQANQQWQLNANGTITGVQSGLCLDVTGASTADGALADLWSCNGQSNQQWTLR